MKQNILGLVMVSMYFTFLTVTIGLVFNSHFSNNVKKLFIVSEILLFIITIILIILYFVYKN